MQGVCEVYCALKSHKIGQEVPYVLTSERPGHTVGFTTPGKVGASCGYSIAHRDIFLNQTNGKLNRNLSDGRAARMGVVVGQAPIEFTEPPHKIPGTRVSAKARRVPT